MDAVVDAEAEQNGADEAGELIAKVKVVPNVSALTSARNGINAARTQVETARLDFENQKSIYLRSWNY